MDKHTIITMKLKGDSNREVARKTGFDRKTVARYWNRYQEDLTKLGVCDDIRLAQEKIISKPKYDTSNRFAVKYTDEIDQALDAILEQEEQKRLKLGVSNKQMLTCVQIHRMLVDQGFDIGKTTITEKVSEKRKRTKEAFIRQHYDFGERLEYDFGEVKLEIEGVVGTYHMAVFGSPAARFRWAYLYRNQKKDVFLDSHVRFFEMVKGVWAEVVYDNMKNVVARFIGRNERELNSDLVKMGIYYGFSINVTNCFSGNEKGYVESSVKALRREVFADTYSFASFEDACDYLQARLMAISSSSDIEEEKKYLNDYKPPLEIAKIVNSTVDKYSFVRVQNNFYSVPDYLVGHELVVKTYVSGVVVYAGLDEVCRHKRCTGSGEMSVNIFHYLDTLSKKPGALTHSAALKQCHVLKAVYDEYFSDNPRAFIECLKDNAEKPLTEIVAACQNRSLDTTTFSSKPECGIAANILAHSRIQLGAISTALLKRGEKIAS